MFEAPEVRVIESIKGLREVETFLDEFVFSEAINPREFCEDQGGTYSTDMVEGHMKYLTRVEETFMAKQFTLGKRIEEENRRRIARAMEGIVLHNIGMNDWLGENAHVIVPSRYDDVVHGIDGIVEFHNGQSHTSFLALAMDVVVSMEGSSQRICDKLNKIKSEITNGKLSEVTYFKSGRFRGVMQHVPRVVVAADGKTVEGLLGLTAEKKNRSLAEHYMQIQIILEISLQLKTFLEYAKNNDLPQRVIIALETDQKAIVKIWESKRNNLGDAKYGELRALAQKDVAFQAVSDGLKTIF